MVTYIFGVHQALVAVDRTRAPSAVFFAKVHVPQQRIVFFFTVLRITCIILYAYVIIYDTVVFTEHRTQKMKKC